MVIILCPLKVYRYTACKDGLNYEVFHVQFRTNTLLFVRQNVPCILLKIIYIDLSEIRKKKCKGHIFAFMKVKAIMRLHFFVTNGRKMSKTIKIHECINITSVFARLYLRSCCVLLLLKLKS